MTAPAPGPYMSANLGSSVVVCDGYRKRIATVYGKDAYEREANAALLAAAPAMLKVLEAVAHDGTNIKPQTLQDVRRMMFDLTGKVIK